MDIAEAGVLSKGFDATSIDEIVAEAEITKGGFFYHFPDKNALALALIQRYIEREDALFDSLLERAGELSDDPLHSVLIALRLLAEMLEDLPSGHPGCLVATAAYQDRLFSPEVHAMNRDAVTRWRVRFAALFEQIAERYPPRDDVDFQDLADMLSGIVEGGIILSKVFHDPKLIARQVMLLRSYIKLLFSPPPAH